MISTVGESQQAFFGNCFIAKTKLPILFYSIQKIGIVVRLCDNTNTQCFDF